MKDQKARHREWGKETSDQIPKEIFKITIGKINPKLILDNKQDISLHQPRH